MSAGQAVILVIVLLAVVAVAIFAVRASRRKKLQSTFGPEYDRVVADTGNRTEAEKELRDRERRHSELELRELSPESKARYAADWEEVQIQFVDSPEQAVGRADELVTRLITERGYPTGEFDDRLATLSVDHARTLGHYRDAHEISERQTRGEAGTEDLRQALVHYRALFADLLGEDPVQSSGTTATTSATPAQTSAFADDTAPDRTDSPVRTDVPPQSDARTAADRPVNNRDVTDTRPDATPR
jgi:hypothetical protein